MVIKLKLVDMACTETRVTREVAKVVMIQLIVVLLKNRGHYYVQPLTLYNGPKLTKWLPESYISIMKFGHVNLQTHSPRLFVSKNSTLATQIQDICAYDTYQN